MSQERRAASCLAAWLPAIGLLLASGAGAAWLQLRAHDGPATLAVLFPPWWPSAGVFEAAAAADVAVLRAGA